MLSFSIGLNDQRTKSAIENQISHIQIHSKKYLEDNKSSYTIENIEELSSTLENIESINYFSKRLILDATISTAHGFKNVRLIGIDPEQESLVTKISENIDSGTYFNEFKNNPLVIGGALAEDLKISVKKSANIGFQDGLGNFVQYGFRVEGIFNTPDSRFDKSTLFVKRKNLEELAFMEGAVHEIAIICDDIEKSQEITDIINAKFPDIQADTWKETSPELGYADEMMGTMIAIFLGIIIFALTFGILNTMLMAVLERKKEIGVLMSVGMNKSKIFMMIMLETLFLASVASPFGLLLSYFLIQYYGIYGIDLSVVGEGMSGFGAESIIYTTIEGQVYWLMALMIVIAALLSSIVPARKALKYDPAEAVKAI